MSRHELTAAGFRYLLKSTNEQVWTLLREYIRSAEQASGEHGGGLPSVLLPQVLSLSLSLTPPLLRALFYTVSSHVPCLSFLPSRPLHHPPGKELASTLSFLMQLSFRRVWQPYPLGDLSQQEQTIAAHMAQLGLVHVFAQVRACNHARGAGRPRR